MNKLKKTEIDLQREISFIIKSKVNDPRIGFITITYVRLSSDYRYMDAYFSLMDKEPENIKLCMIALDGCKGFIKKNIKSRIKMKTIPEIRFVYDKSIDNGLRINSIIEGLKLKNID